MDRTKVMIGYLRPYLVEHIHAKIDECKLVEEMTLLPKVKMLLEKALVVQSICPEWRPAYIGVFHLLTGLLTESHEFELIVADEQLYLDELKCVDEWAPEFIYNKEQELVNLIKQLQRKFSGLNDYETNYIRRWIFYEYRNLIGVYWKNQIDKILEFNGYKKLKKSDSFSFLFGDYMGTTHIILKDKKESM